MKIYTNEDITKKLKNKNRFHLLLKIIFYPIIAAIIGISLYLCIQKVQNPNGIANVFGYRVFSVTSGSLEPTIKIGDLVIVKSVDNSDEIKEDDIITFREGDNFVTHRVVGVSTAEGKISYTTKGDNNNTKDDKSVLYASVEGKYVKHIANVGAIIIACQNIYFVILVLLFAYCIYFVFSKREDRRIYRHEKRLEYEKNEIKRTL